MGTSYAVHVAKSADESASPGKQLSLGMVHKSNGKERGSSTFLEQEPHHLLVKRDDHDMLAAADHCQTTL